MSRTRCGMQCRTAEPGPIKRDKQHSNTMDPGSEAHHAALAVRCAASGERKPAKEMSMKKEAAVWAASSSMLSRAIMVS
jgi:protein-disulfide isomerase